MLIKRKSMISGIEREREIPVTKEQYEKFLNGALIQDAFPYISDNDREFILTGVTEEEWDEAFGDDE